MQTEPHPLKNRADLENYTDDIIHAWRTRQRRNPTLGPCYLYYAESGPDHAGGLALVQEDEQPRGWHLASPLPYRAETYEQARHRMLQTARTLPILDPRS